MSVENPEIQTAITKLLRAGFQVSPATLQMLQGAPNPQQIVDKFLASDIVHPTDTPVLEPTHFDLHKEKPLETKTEEPLQDPESPQLTHPRFKAEGVKTRIKIRKDPTPQLQSKGTVEDFISNFQDRYSRLRDIISQRVDGKGVININEVEEGNNIQEKGKTATVKIVGLITSKTTTKSGNIALELED
ncbi:MAG: hypothetical protein ACFFDT_22620, partial [Candidatus Hodarchaeota archaeon]